MYETFEHTADLGLRARAPDLETLFAEAAKALFAAVVEDPATVQTPQCVEISIAGDEREYLLFDWLRALLGRLDTEHLLFSEFDVHIDSHGLMARAWGETLDPERHHLIHEVKAITYHGLRVEQTADGWLAEVIVDI
jgi:SHS2 domain-containing protein